MEKENLTFNEKMVKVQSELKAPKGQFNSFGKYKYRSCEDIVESVKPILAKYGLTLNLSDELELIGNRYYIKATATITDSEEGIKSTAYAREPDSKKGMDESQVTGTASSYARKYALNGLLAIDDTKDPDTDEYANQTKSTQDPKLIAKLEELGGSLEIAKTIFKKNSINEVTNDEIKALIERKEQQLKEGK